MDLAYLAYAASPTAFYELPQPAGDDLVALAGEPPAGYRQNLNREWCGWSTHDDLPAQGWKIHVSATTESAHRVLLATLRYCTRSRVNVKFLRSMSTLARRNSKYGDRGASGKFITIYPRDDGELERILRELDSEIGGEQGPTILSDLRWAEGPLYVRYGAFVLRYGRDEHGRQVPCIEAPDGTLVPDERRPGFHPPEWVRLPGFLDEAVQARGRGTLDDFPYAVKSAIHFSNGGGVYLAEDTRTGGKVVLKEARPHAGIDEAGVDAVERLKVERDSLEMLDGVRGVPRLIDFRRGHAHEFLAREFVDGAPLSAVIHRLNPAMPGAKLLDTTAYTDWAIAVHTAVASGIAAVHRRGIVFGDLHPGNIIVGDDGEVGFIDFEAASRVEENRPQRIGAPGFRAPAGWCGTRVDHFALAMLRVALFLPVTETLGWTPSLTHALVDAAVDRFPDAAAFLAPAREMLLSAWVDAAPPAPAATVQETREQLAQGILSTASPERTDRLFPGDIAQFQSQTAGIEFAFGASGVLWSLHRAGFAVGSDHVDWIVARMHGNDLIGPGLFEGAAGVGLVLRALGEHEASSAALARAARFPVEKLDSSLWRGIAGVGLALLDELTDEAVARARELAHELRRRRDAPTAGPTGLFQGGAGRALFLLALAEATGEESWVADAVAELDRDLDLIGWSSSEPPAPGGPWHHPAASAGSAGIALAARTLGAFDDDARWPRIVEDVRRPDGILARSFLPHVGLLRGRAGVGVMLAELWRGETAPPEIDEVLERHRRDCRLGIVPLGSTMLSFGDHSLKLSADWATGAAGLISAFDAMGGAGLEFPGRTTRAEVRA